MATKGNGAATTELAENVMIRREGSMLWVGVDLSKDIDKTNKNGSATIIGETSGYRGQEVMIDGVPHTVVHYVARRHEAAKRTVSL